MSTYSRKMIDECHVARLKQQQQFFLGLVDPSRKRLASMAYFTIISSIILWSLLSGSFVRGASCQVFLTDYHRLTKRLTERSGREFCSCVG